MVKKISENEFSEVLGSKAALVDFSATWCGPCKMLAPVLEGISEAYGDKVAFYNIDVDVNPSLAAEYGIQSIPTLLLLKNGRPVDRSLGFMPKPKLVSFIESGPAITS